MTTRDREIVGTEHRIERDGIELYMWEKRVGSPDGRPVVILAHGSATAGRESFDLEVAGKPSYSLMDTLAAEGFDVFAPDVRGFGRSTHPDVHVTTQQASEDLNAAVDHVMASRGVDRVNLLGWSWGTQYGGMFVMAYPDKVGKYVSYAQMHAESPDIIRRRPRLEFFRKTPYVNVPEAIWKARFYSMTPAAANDPDVVEAYARAALLAEPRTSTGPQLDLVTLMPMISARLMPVPTMVIHGEYDDVADLDGLLSFFRQLPNSRKKYVVVPEAGHMMHLQRGHRLFQSEVIDFFKAE